MQEVKKLGIWMCHTSIHLVEFNSNSVEKADSKQLAEVHTKDTDHAELQNEAFHLQTESFKKLGIAIEKYEEVLIFGPVDSKVELFKFLKADPRFNTINIQIKQTYSMSEDQQQTFVENHFSGLKVIDL